MIKAILWDNDGVLVDTETFFFRATKDVLASLGVHLSKEQFIDYSLVKGYGFCDYMAAGGLDVSGCEPLRLQRNSLYSSYLRTTHTLIDGVEETLSALHGRYAMGIVTSSQREHFDIIHEKTGILKYFDFVITSDECENTKPHPEPYLKGLAHAGVSGDECLVVEDSARGLSAANRAGIKCLMIPHELSGPENYKGDYLLLQSIRDVARTIESITTGCETH
ncbi:MAG: HAD family phosphatase [Desulfobacteraceae bacterium]|jgi:HAD superfamily hydrolase (TIGR01509 family)